MKTVETFSIQNIVGTSRKEQITLDARHVSATGSFADVEGADNLEARKSYRRLGQMLGAEMARKDGAEVVRAVASYRNGKKLSKKAGGGFKPGVASLTTRTTCEGSKMKFTLLYQFHVARRQAQAVKAAADEAKLMAAVASAEAKGKAALAAKAAKASQAPVAAKVPVLV